MYSFQTYEAISALYSDNKWMSQEANAQFACRLSANLDEIHTLYHHLYQTHPNAAVQFNALIAKVISAHNLRSASLRDVDQLKLQKNHWITSNEIVGMSLYVDRFASDIEGLQSRLDYFDELGVNLLHLMPLMESPKDASDGGYAVSNFKAVDQRFGSLSDLTSLITSMRERGMYVMLDIVLNHTSYLHEWAQKASEGDKDFQDFYYMYDSRDIPDEFEKSMPEIFPDSSPGNFTYDKQSGKWVMTVFNDYQWDLNFTNPAVLVAMLDNIFFYASLGVDILRIDAPAFIWKTIGTRCQNLPQAHTLLQLIKLCVQSATPGMALLGEAIVAPKEIMKYFGLGAYLGKECDVAYNATHMALQWDALATGDTRIMLAAQHDILQKPYGVTWLTYTRCHDDIGLGYDDAIIASAGFEPYQHRKFIKDYYSGNFPNSPSRGALFGVNEKTSDARISGSLASLCGLEMASELGDPIQLSKALDKILLMQAMSMTLGGIPMLYYGDEVGYTNDYTYSHDPAKSYDNRWMHRPMIDWVKNDRRMESGTHESMIFNATRRLIALRKLFPVFADHNNLRWMKQRSHHVAAFVRYSNDGKVYCVFNFSQNDAYITWFVFRDFGIKANDILTDVWSALTYTVGNDDQYLRVLPYQFMILHLA
jgi:amylosucrase